MDKMLIKLLPIMASVSGLAASVEGGLPVDPNSLDALARWPLTVILGAVCVTCVYFMYRQSRDNAERSMGASREHAQTILQIVEADRTMTEQRINSTAVVAKELADNNAKLVQELAEGHAKNLKLLLEELSKERTK